MSGHNSSSASNARPRRYNMPRNASGVGGHENSMAHRLIPWAPRWVIGIALLVLSACLGPPGTFTVAHYTINSVLDNRSASTKFNDDFKELKLRASLFDFSRIKALVYKDKAYVMGYVESKSQADEVKGVLRANGFSEFRSLLMQLSELSSTFGDDILTSVQIRRAFLDDPDISSFNVHVMSVGGAVLLAGQVESRTQKLKATYVMEELGLKLIRNYLEIIPPDPSSTRPKNTTDQGG